MGELTTRTTQLPDTIEDLSQFVLVSRAKLNAYMIKLKAINRLSDAQNVREQTFQEAQDVANALIAAEQRIGEILLSIPKASGGDRKSDDFKNRDTSNFEKSKSETIKEQGYTKDQASDYQRMAQNPAVVNMVIEQAERDGRIVSHAQVMKEIKALNDKIAEQERRVTQLGSDNRNLVRQLDEAKKNVKVKEVKVEVVPEDYEETKKQLRMYKGDNERLNKENRERSAALLEANRTIRELREPSADDKLVSSAVESMDHFAIATYEYIRKYGGYVWAFEKWNDVPKETRDNFTNAIVAISGFAQQMANNVGGLT